MNHVLDPDSLGDTAFALVFLAILLVLGAAQCCDLAGQRKERRR